MRSKTFRGVLIALLALSAIALGEDAVHAGAGTCPDEADDTFVGDPSNDVGPGALDIVNNTHDDSSSTITYTLTTDTGFNAEDVDHIRWEVNADDDEEFEGSLVVRGDPLQAEFVNLGDGATSTAVVEHTDGEPELTASYSRSELSDVGVGDNYEYLVTTVETTDAYREDNTGPCTHALSEPEPSATPTPAPSSGSLTLDSSQIAPGGTISGTATGLRPDSEASFVVFSAEQEVGSETADSSGSARFSFTVPSNLAVGSHTIEARGVDTNGNTRVLSAQFEVVAAQPQVASPAPTATPQSALPNNGAPIARTAMVGSTLLLVGLTLIAINVRGRPRTFAVYFQRDPGWRADDPAEWASQTAELFLGPIASGGDVVDPSRARGSVYSSQITRLIGGG